MPSETKRATLRWDGGLRFTGGDPQGPAVLVDGASAAGPSPMTALLLAVAGCSGADVVSILEKMRVELREFTIEVAGVRREQEPRRYLSMHLAYRMGGKALDEAKGRRAIDLSIEKYCSVMHSLAPDIRITYELELV